MMTDPKNALSANFDNDTTINSFPNGQDSDSDEEDSEPDPPPGSGGG